MIYKKTFSIIFFGIIITLISSCSINDRVKNGDLNNCVFYAPSVKQTIGFRNNGIVHFMAWDGYPWSKYSTSTIDKLLNYSYDAKSQSGILNGTPFTITFTHANTPACFLSYNGDSYILDESASDSPNGWILYPLCIIFLGIGVFFLRRAAHIFRNMKTQTKI